MLKATGLGELIKELDIIKKALAELDGELVNVSFVVDDPSSLEMAIQEANQLIDSRISDYANNPVVASLIDEAKENIRERILQKAAETRLLQSKDN